MRAIENIRIIQVHLLVKRIYDCLFSLFRLNIHSTSPRCSIRTMLNHPDFNPFILITGTLNP